MTMHSRESVPANLYFHYLNNNASYIYNSLARVTWLNNISMHSYAKIDSSNIAVILS